MKASRGKRGCLKQNGRLKKGFRWAKGRKGQCVVVKPKAKKQAKRGSKSAKTAAGEEAMWAALKARQAAVDDGDRHRGGGFDGLPKRRRKSRR